MHYLSLMDSNPDNPFTADDSNADFAERRMERQTASRPARLSSGQGGGTAGRIRNLSRAGFMAECAEPVRIGSYVLIDVPGIGPIEAQVRWQIGPRMGGMFLDPITLARCEWISEDGGAPGAP